MCYTCVGLAWVESWGFIASQEMLDKESRMWDFNLFLYVFSASNQVLLFLYG